MKDLFERLIIALRAEYGLKGVPVDDYKAKTMVELANKIATNVLVTYGADDHTAENLRYEVLYKAAEFMEAELRKLMD